MAKKKRGNPYAGQSGIKNGRWTREAHEESAIRSMKAAEYEVRTHGSTRHHPGAGKCAPSTAYSVLRANRDIAQARVHLSAIGPAEGKRTSRLWAALQRVQKKVDGAGNYVAKCMGDD